MRPSVSGRSDHPETVVPWNGSPEIAARRASRSRPSTTRRGIPAFAITRAPTGSNTIFGPARECPSPVRAINFAYGIRSKRCANGFSFGSSEYTPSTLVAFTSRSAFTTRARLAATRSVVHPGDVEEELRELREVRRLAIRRNEDGPAQGDHDPFHGDDRVRIPALRKYLPSSGGPLRISMGKDSWAPSPSCGLVTENPCPSCGK